MGRAILHGHILDDVERVPDGYFGTPERIEGCDFILPVDDSDLVGRFRTVFGLERRSEPGLSVVVPWYLDSEITPDDVVCQGRPKNVPTWRSKSGPPWEGF
jgi:hypothetical protein